VFKKYVDVFIVQSEFQKKKFIELGIPGNKIEILPGITPDVKAKTSGSVASYITFVGRISPEKGIDDFLAAAKRLPALKFAIAGNVPEATNYEKSPANVEWRGFLKGAQLDGLYQESAVIIVPSRWYEGFPNIITRAMDHSKPVITTDIGCFPDIIDHGINGFMYPSGNIDTLVEHIQWIFRNPVEASMMGQNGRKKAEIEYSGEVIYQKLIGIYSEAIGS
jgi:glycosyltransferase involved in cell wall biosynthesis